MTEQEYILKYREVFLHSISEPIYFETDLPVLANAVATTLGQVASLIEHFPELRDVDLVSDEFLGYLFKEYLPDFPYLPNFNYREFIKESKTYYSSKGTKNALAYIAALGGLVFNVWEPAKYILGPSSRSLYPSGGFVSRAIDGSGRYLGRIRDGIFWSKYTYVIDVGNLKNIDSIDMLLPLIDLNHPAGTKYFLNYFWHTKYERATTAADRFWSEEITDFYDYEPQKTTVCVTLDGQKFVTSASQPSGLDLLSGRVQDSYCYERDFRDKDWMIDTREAGAFATVAFRRTLGDAFQDLSYDYERLKYYLYVQYQPKREIKDSIRRGLILSHRLSPISDAVIGRWHDFNYYRVELEARGPGGYLHPFERSYTLGHSIDRHYFTLNNRQGTAGQQAQFDSAFWPFVNGYGFDERWVLRPIVSDDVVNFQYRFEKPLDEIPTDVLAELNEQPLTLAHFNFYQPNANIWEAQLFEGTEIGLLWWDRRWRLPQWGLHWAEAGSRHEIRAWRALHETLVPTLDKVADYLGRVYSGPVPIKSAKQYQSSMVVLGQRQMVGLGAALGTSALLTGNYQEEVGETVYESLTLSEFIEEATDNVRYEYVVTDATTGLPITIVENPTGAAPLRDHFEAKELLESLFYHRVAPNTELQAALMTSSVFLPLTHDYATTRSVGVKYDVYGNWKARPLSDLLPENYHSVLWGPGGTARVTASRYWDDVITPATHVQPRRRIHQPSANIIRIDEI
jgi:hypothetical protein